MWAAQRRAGAGGTWGCHSASLGGGVTDRQSRPYEVSTETGTALFADLVPNGSWRSPLERVCEGHRRVIERALSMGPNWMPTWKNLVRDLRQ